MSNKQNTTKNNNHKRKVLLATLLPLGSVITATAITVPVVMLNNKDKVNIELVDTDTGVKISNYSITKGADSTISLEIPSGKVIDNVKVVIEGKELVKDQDFSIDNTTIKIKGEKVTSTNIKLTVTLKADEPIAYKKAVVLKNNGQKDGKILLSRTYTEDVTKKIYQANFEISTDGTNWTKVSDYAHEEYADYEISTQTIKPNSTLFVRGENHSMYYEDDEHKPYSNRISIAQEGETWTEGDSASIELSGSIMGLLDCGGTKPKPAEWTMPEFCFQFAFILENDDFLPALTSVSKDFLSSDRIVNHLSVGCFRSLFCNCRHLKNSPDLPSTILAENCYASMFEMWDESDLVTPPELPAKELAAGCYWSMFYNCTKLVTPPALPAETLKNGCYENMFMGCKSLTSAPKLPATTLVERCYRYMFKGCSQLKIKENNGEESKEIFTCPTYVFTEVEDMFAETGGDFHESPTENNTYYYY